MKRYTHMWIDKFWTLPYQEVPVHIPYPIVHFLIWYHTYHTMSPPCTLSRRPGSRSSGLEVLRSKLAQLPRGVSDPDLLSSLKKKLVILFLSFKSGRIFLQTSKSDWEVCFLLRVEREECSRRKIKDSNDKLLTKDNYLKLLKPKYVRHLILKIHMQ